MKILYLSSFAEPNPINGNRTSTAIVEGLHNNSLDVVMLTTSKDPSWTGPTVEGLVPLGLGAYLKTRRNGINYLLIQVVDGWAERTPDEDDWKNAVDFGVQLLQIIKPEIVHMQQWQNVWWLAESARILKIPLVYSVNDYGLTCGRTFLVKGDSSLCNGEVEYLKCSKCVFSGRSWLGKCSELMSYIPGVLRIRKLLIQKNRHLRLLPNIQLNERMKVHLDRVRNILNYSECIIVGSKFGRAVHQQYRLNNKKIVIMPWFHEQRNVLPPFENVDGCINIGFIGRISPEKGLDTLLNALVKIKTPNVFCLHVGGEISGLYAIRLNNKYKEFVGSQRIIWHGWIENKKLDLFYKNIHLGVVPSKCIETGPLSMLECLAHSRPVICTDIEPLREINKRYGIDLHFPIDDCDGLAQKLTDLYTNKEELIRYSNSTKVPPLSESYVDEVLKIYKEIKKRS